MHEAGLLVDIQRLMIIHRRLPKVTNPTNFPKATPPNCANDHANSTIMCYPS